MPLGLNVCDDFHPLNQVMRGPSLIGSAKSAMEKELRRNCFWLAYSVRALRCLSFRIWLLIFWIRYQSDRQQGCSNEWALNMDDQDLPQLMPARGDQFDLEVRVPMIVCLSRLADVLSSMSILKTTVRCCSRGTFSSFTPKNTPTRSHYTSKGPCSYPESNSSTCAS